MNKTRIIKVVIYGNVIDSFYLFQNLKSVDKKLILVISKKLDLHKIDVVRDTPNQSFQNGPWCQFDQHWCQKG